MNKIFKVIWSKSKECYVVVSEIANNYSAKKAVLTSVFAVLALTGSAAHVMGATLPSELTDKGSIKIGQYATTSNMSSIIIGTSSEFRMGIGQLVLALGLLLVVIIVFLSVDILEQQKIRQLLSVVRLMIVVLRRQVLNLLLSVVIL